MSRKNVKYGLKSPGAMIIAVTIMAVGLLTVFGVTVAFADTIVCSPSPDPCNGTNNSDTMTANAGSNIAGFTINGLDGSDTIAANEVSIGGFGHDLTVNGNDGSDTIIATKQKGLILRSDGGTGDDRITLTGKTIDNIVGIGGNGKDFISASGNVRLDLVLFQNNLANDPDGSRDTLNCNNNPVSKAYISVADGDVAINCKTVVKN
jgi:hypothetical protein